MLSSSSVQKSRANRWFLGGLVLVTLLAAALRLYKLDEGSFWLDELYTVSASANLSNMHTSKVLGYVPTVLGLYIAGIDPNEIPDSSSTWRAIGLTEQVVRMPTCILGVLTIPIIALASLRLVGARVALIVALLLAVAPWHIYWSQAARFYVPQFLFFTLSVIFYFVATRDGSRRQFAAAMTCLVLAFLSQPTSLLLLGIFAIDWAVSRWRHEAVKFDSFQWTCLLSAIGVCTWIIAQDIWAAPDEWTQFVEEGARHQTPLRMLLGAAYMIGPSVVVAAALSAVGLWRRDRRAVIYFALVATLPIATFAAMSQWAFIGLRYSFIALIGWLILTAAGVDRLYSEVRSRAGSALAQCPLAVILAALCTANYIYFNSYGNLHARWKDAAEFVRATKQPNDAVRASDVHTAAYYMQQVVQPLPSSPAEVLKLDKTTWFIVEVTHSNKSSGRYWLLDQAELVDVFALKAAHGTSSMHVYRYAPNNHLAHQ